MSNGPSKSQREEVEVVSPGPLKKVKTDGVKDAIRSIADTRDALAISSVPATPI